MEPIVLTKEELRNLLAIVARAQITGAEATTVALLQQKIAAMLNEPEKPPPTEIPHADQT
jgi:hypothetical protein